jgi:uncharacterized protein YcbK (DUF882 family)
MHGLATLLYNPPMPAIIAYVSSILLLVFTPAEADVDSDARTLKLYHTHTLETLEVTYFENGLYLLEPMEQLRAFLADWRNGDQREIDPKLMDILWEIQRVTGNNNTFEVISAYRSMKTNRYLRNKSSGVAQNSQHIHGKAIDVRLRGLDTRELRDVALALQLGGVGYYESTDFVHVDTGRVRRW